METVRRQIRQLLDELDIKQSELVQAINAQHIYRVTPSEVSSAIQGLLTTPKGHRIVADCYSLLTRVQARRERTKT